MSVSAPDAPNGAVDVPALQASIKEQGELVRKLKSEGGAAGEVDAAVKRLLELKAQLPEEFQEKKKKKKKGAASQGPTKKELRIKARKEAEAKMAAEKAARAAAKAAEN